MDTPQLQALAEPFLDALFDHKVNLRELRVARVLVRLSLSQGLPGAFVAEQRDLCLLTRLSEGDVSEALQWLGARGIFRHHPEENRWEPWPNPTDWRPVDPAEATEPVRCRHRGATARHEATLAWARLRADARTGPRAPWLSPELDPRADPFTAARMEVSCEQSLYELTLPRPARSGSVMDRSPEPASARGLPRPPEQPDRAVHNHSSACSGWKVSFVPPAGLASSVAPALVKFGPGLSPLGESLSEACRKSLGIGESLSAPARVSRASASDASDAPDEKTSSPSDASDGSGRPGGSELHRQLAETFGAESWAQWRRWWAPILATARGRAVVVELLGELKWRRAAAAIGRAKPVRNVGGWLNNQVRRRMHEGSAS